MQQINIKKISKSGACTGCGLCENICPRKCIFFKVDEVGSVYPEIMEEQCCNCGICEKICPENDPVDLKRPMNAYVAVKNSKSVEEGIFPSSSGGIANLIYLQTLKEGGICVGTLWNSEFEVELHSTEDIDTLEYFKNSKYVYSKMGSLFQELTQDVMAFRKITVIALPCQIAALKKKFGESAHILYVDLVCHGVTNSCYFQEYLDNLNIEKENIDNITFRVPGGGYGISVQNNWEGG